MKLLIILSLYAVSVLGKVDISIDELSKYLGQCLNETGNHKTGKPIDREQACVYTCIDKKLGVMTEDGKFVKERLLDFAQTEKVKAETSRMYDEGMEKCKEFEGADPCLLTLCFYKAVKVWR